jgi:6-methylsalicylic acid synthase
MPAAPGERRLPLLRELPTRPAVEVSAQHVSPPWTGLTGAALLEYLTDEIRRQVAAETKLAIADVDPRRPLVEMGLDSVMTVRIRRSLDRHFHVPLPATLFWDRPTIDTVADWLAERIANTATASPHIEGG